MIIGYSFWGFLGSGILDTPDGGRSHRRVFVDGLRSRGHQLVFLQANRDLLEAGTDLTDCYQWDIGLPTIDLLFLEWRWPIPGRNTTPCETAGHTCDLHRQQQIVDHYTHMRRIPTIVWDKDRQLSAADPLRHQPNVVVCEPALHPSHTAVPLLFPVSDHVLDTADPVALAAQHRNIPLAYIGNQYDRNHAFDTYFAPAASIHRHVVAGKWTQTTSWPHVTFLGRVPFEQVGQIYRQSISTVLLLPDRYATVGHMTQRLVEAVLRGCLPITPTAIRGAKRFTPPALHVSNGSAVSQLIDTLVAMAGSTDHAELIAACLRKLDLFRLSQQLEVLDELLTGPRAVQGAR